MTPTDFELLVREALRATRDRSDAAMVATAAAAGDMDGYDLVALVASWVTAALDPDGAHGTAAQVGPVWPASGFPVFRLQGLEAVATREQQR